MFVRTEVPKEEGCFDPQNKLWWDRATNRPVITHAEGADPFLLGAFRLSDGTEVTVTDDERGELRGTRFSVWAPNAKAVRFHESGALISLLHKWTMRTCFNAQEEIYDASMDAWRCSCNRSRQASSNSRRASTSDA